MSIPSILDVIKSIFVSSLYFDFILLAGYVNLLSGEEKCQGLPMSQLENDEERKFLPAADSLTDEARTYY
jgi:hypothetical protein